MGRSVRQIARQQALEAQAKRRQQRAKAERRYSALGVDVAVALSQRDASVGRYERAAGAAIAALTGVEGLTIVEACSWAGEITVAEGERLRQLAAGDGKGSSTPD